MWTYDLFELWKKKRISLSRKISCFLFCPYFERERESSTLLDSVYCIDIFGCIYGHLLYRLDWDYARLYFWVHLWPPFFFFLHIKLNNNDLTTTATNTSWPPALLLRIPFSRKKRILLSRKISCFLFCPYFERERERKFYSFGQCLLHRYFWVHLTSLALQVRFMENS